MSIGLQDDFHQAGFAGVEAVEPLRAVGERGDGADQRVDVDCAAGDELDGPRVFAGRCAAADERELAGDDGSAAGTALRAARLPTRPTRPPRRTQSIAVASAGALPTTSTATSAPSPAVSSRTAATASVSRLLIVAVAPSFLASCEPAVVDVDGDDFVAAGDAQRLNHQAGRSCRCRRRRPARR